jgi:hypothetical protein
MIYKQTEIAKDKGWNRGKTKQVRDEFLTEGTHWWKEGTVIFWNQEALDIIDGVKAVEAKEPVTYPELGGESLEALVVYQHKNPTWVRGRVDGAGVDILIPKALGSRLVGKTIRIEKAEDDGFTPYYKYLP